MCPALVSPPSAGIASTCQHIWLVVLGLWLSNSSPQACKASTALAEPSLQPLFVLNSQQGTSQPKEPFPEHKSQIPALTLWSPFSPVQTLSMYTSVLLNQGQVCCALLSGECTGNVQRHLVTGGVQDRTGLLTTDEARIQKNSVTRISDATKQL